MNNKLKYKEFLDILQNALELNNNQNENSEKLFDLYWRSEISLYFKSKDEVKNLILYVDDHNGKPNHPHHHGNIIHWHAA